MQVMFFIMVRSRRMGQRAVYRMARINLSGQQGRVCPAAAGDSTNGHIGSRRRLTLIFSLPDFPPECALKAGFRYGKGLVR